MRRLCALILALILLCPALPVSAETEDVTGTWVTVRFIGPAGEMDPRAYRICVTMTLNADGTAQGTNVSGENRQDWQGTWTCENGRYELAMGTLNAEEFVPEDGLLKITEGSLALVFARAEEAPEAPEVIVPPEAAAAESGEAFLGTWMLESSLERGLYLPLNVLGDGATETLVITPGRMTIIFSPVDPELHYDEEMTTVFRDDGSLWFTNGDTEGFLRLTRDGSLRMQMFEDREEYWYYRKTE